MQTIWEHKVQKVEVFPLILGRFSIAFTANGKRQDEIFSLMKNNEAFLV